MSDNRKRALEELKEDLRRVSAVMAAEKPLKDKRWWWAFCRKCGARFDKHQVRRPHSTACRKCGTGFPIWMLNTGKEAEEAQKRHGIAKVVV